MDPSLYEAATSGDVRFLRETIEDDGASINLLQQKTPKDNNILHISAEFKQIDFFKNVDPDQFGQLFWATNKKGDTPLHVASRVGCHEIVEFLIQVAKQPPSVEGADEESGLADGETHNFKQLLEKTNSQKDTAMHAAVRCCHPKVVLLLMKADPELCCLTNMADESPLFLASRRGFPRTALLILNDCPISPSFQGTNGVTALHAAVTFPRDRFARCSFSGMIHLVKTMVSKRPELIKEVDALGWTPLHYATLRGHLIAVKILLETDSSASYILDESGTSALHVAAYAGHVRVMKEIIRLRQDTCDLLNNKGQNALHAAALGGQKSVVKYILKTPKFAGLIDEEDADGNTPLHLSAISKNYTVLRMLANDRRVNKTAINNKSFQAADILLADFHGFKQDGRRPPFLNLGNSIGVPFFHEQISRHFNKLEASEEEETFDARDTEKERQNVQIKSIFGAATAGLSGIFVALLKGHRWLVISFLVICVCLCLFAILAYIFMPKRQQKKIIWLRTRTL